MSLVGNLEELGLGEILPIVSLSKKTGVLFLNCKENGGSVFFRFGQVVRATSNEFRQNLGELLIEKGIIDTFQLRTALDLQQVNGFQERLGMILCRHCGIAREIIEEAIREQIERVVFSFFAWREGTFRFDAQESPDIDVGLQVDIRQFVLDRGLNPQFLAMEASHIRQRLSHNAAHGEELTEARVSDAATMVPLCRSVVIVDDDGHSLRIIADKLEEYGMVVHAVTHSTDTFTMLASLLENGETPVLLIDLIMPKMDGSGVLGGLELLEHLHVSHQKLQVIMMADYRHADAENRIHELGYPIIVKPRRNELSTPEILSGFIGRFTQLYLHLHDRGAT